MIKKFTFLLVLSSLAFSLSCASGGNTRSNSNAKPAASAEVKKGVAPVADSEIAVVDTDYGTVKIELYSNIAPKMVARFKELAKAGFYNGIAFHRINETVIQAGNPDTKGDVPPVAGKPEGDSGKPNVDAEFSDVPYTTGIVGAARLGNDVNSQNSQFFIMLRSEPQFNGNYTVFGKVVEGMNTVMTISGVPRDRERPNPPVRIKSITIQPK
jgi:cyclophilin family peptidyl-prolyl cis-trans isomerase